MLTRRLDTRYTADYLMMPERARQKGSRAVGRLFPSRRGHEPLSSRCVVALLSGFLTMAPAAAQDTLPAPAALRARLAESAVLRPEEIAELINQTSRIIDGRKLRVADGAVSSPVDERGRDVLFVILSGSVPIEDVGVRSTAAGSVRGLRAPATPPRSEVGAKQTLWIDIATLLPRRFEFAYEVAGLGDIAYDLVFDE